MIKLYENIRYYRKLNSWSQDELAKMMGYTDRSMIAKIESGKVDLSQSKIVEFAKVFGIAPGDLMGWENDDLKVVDLSNVPDASVEELKKAMEFYERFNALPPEKQAALLTLLEVPQNDS